LMSNQFSWLLSSPSCPLYFPYYLVPRGEVFSAYSVAINQML
jgi:hypothetical protein